MTLARRRYKSYKKRTSRSRGRSRGGKKSNMRWIILLLVAILAGLIVTKQLGNDSVETSETDPEKDLKEFLRGNGGGTSSTEGTDDDNHFTAVPDENDGVTSDNTKVLIGAALKEIDAGKIISARNKLNKFLLDMPLSQKDRADIKRELAKLSDIWLFSKQVIAGDTLTGLYQVKDRDYFSTIAPDYKVPYELIMSVNGITDEKKLPLKKIKIVKGPFRAHIQLSKFNMDIYLQHQYVKSYAIGIGKVGKETPTGKWRLKKNGKSDKGPTWRNPDTGKVYVASHPDYPLGARWIPITCLEGEGLEDDDDGDGKKGDGIALHGTKEPKSIGTKCSRGCIRLHDKDVIEVYNMLAAGISRIKIDD
jgi:hypothetical protein